MLKENVVFLLVLDMILGPPRGEARIQTLSSHGWDIDKYCNNSMYLDRLA